MRIEALAAQAVRGYLAPKRKYEEVAIASSREDGCSVMKRTARTEES